MPKAKKGQKKVSILKEDDWDLPLYKLLLNGWWGSLISLGASCWLVSLIKMVAMLIHQAGPWQLPDLAAQKWHLENYSDTEISNLGNTHVSF